MRSKLPNLRNLTQQLAADNQRLQRKFLNSLTLVVDGIVDAANENRWEDVKSQSQSLQTAAQAADCDELVAAAEALVAEAEGDDKLQQARALMKLIGASGREKSK